MTRQTHIAFSRELEKYDKVVSQAFLEAVQNITSAAQIAAIDAAIEARDIPAVLRAVNLGSEFWAPLDRQIGNAFLQGALWQIDQMPGKRNPAGLALRIGFDHRNPRAETWISQRAGNLITEVTDDIRLGAREIVLEGVEQGWGVRRIRQSLIGRLEGNQRKGGIIGLHSNQVRAIINARRELSDPATLQDYMRRAAGIGRKMAPGGVTVRSAIKAERSLTAEEIDRVARLYSDKLLRDRGERIGRTEAHAAFNAGKFESVQQMIDSGRVPEQAVSLIWQSTIGSFRTRDSHRRMNGQTVDWGEPFISPLTNAALRYPGDTGSGAPARETINCRCSMVPRIDFVSMAT